MRSRDGALRDVLRKNVGALPDVMVTIHRLAQHGDCVNMIQVITLCARREISELRTGALRKGGVIEMTYAPFIEKEAQIQETRAKYEEALQPFNRTAPRPFPEETRDEYRRRALPILQNYAPGMQDVKVHDARGTAFDMIEKQTFEAAAREAQHPTQIPEGELREIKRLDQAGRVSLRVLWKTFRLDGYFF